MQTINAVDVKSALSTNTELALLDVREYGQYGEGHPFFAVNMPYSTLERQAAALLPSLQTHCVLIDDNDGIAEKAANRLESMGYRHVSVLENGAGSWSSAGYTLYRGVNLPSKSYGEILEHQAGTPSVTASELSAMMRGEHPPLLLDGRTALEFQKMNIPGARSMPNAEIGHRLDTLLDNENRTIVVNCAGRTRSILGAQTLRQIGIKNPIFALENGTAGWSLAGLKLEHGHRAAPLPELSPEQMAQSTRLGEDYRRRFNLPTLSRSEMNTLQDDTRCLYLLDVRSREEYLKGHLPGSRHAPGGQLVQATDQWIAVRGARIVLIDDSGLRASTTAHWLRNMGHEAYVLDEDVRQLAELETGTKRLSAHWTTDIAPEAVPLAALTAALNKDAALIDVSTAMEYRRHHIEGAHWGIRPRLSNLSGRAGWKPERKLILCGGDEAIRQLAARELRDLGFTNLAQVDGNPTDWQQAGLPLEATPDTPSDEHCIDYLFFVHDRHDGNLVAARQYLEWEVGLLEQLDEQERGVFRQS